MLMLRSSERRKSGNFELPSSTSRRAGGGGARVSLSLQIPVIRRTQKVGTHRFTDRQTLLSYGNSTALESNLFEFACSSQVTPPAGSPPAFLGGCDNYPALQYRSSIPLTTDMHSTRLWTYAIRARGKGVKNGSVSSDKLEPCNFT